MKNENILKIKSYNFAKRAIFFEANLFCKKDLNCFFKRLF